MEPYVPAEKILLYLLREPGKAKFFTTFGYSIGAWERLRDDLLQRSAQHEAILALIFRRGEYLRLSEKSAPRMGD